MDIKRTCSAYFIPADAIDIQPNFYGEPRIVKVGIKEPAYIILDAVEYGEVVSLDNNNRNPSYDLRGGSITLNPAFDELLVYIYACIKVGSSYANIVFTSEDKTGSNIILDDLDTGDVYVKLGHLTAPSDNQGNLERQVEFDFGNLDTATHVTTIIANAKQSITKELESNLQKLPVPSIPSDQYLRKDQDDHTPHSLSIGGTLSVGSSASVAGSLTVDGSVSAAQDLTIHGSSAILGSSTTHGDSTVYGSTTTHGDSTTHGTLSIGTPIPDITLGIGTRQGISLSPSGLAKFKDVEISGSLKASKLEYNAIEVLSGSYWKGAGKGVVKQLLSFDEATHTGTFLLDIMDGTSGEFVKGDILRGFWHNMDADGTVNDSIATETTDDRQGNITVKGFASLYLAVLAVEDYTETVTRYETTTDADGNPTVLPITETKTRTNGKVSFLCRQFGTTPILNPDGTVTTAPSTVLNGDPITTPVPSSASAATFPRSKGEEGRGEGSSWSLPPQPNATLAVTGSFDPTQKARQCFTVETITYTARYHNVTTWEWQASNLVFAEGDLTGMYCLVYDDRTGGVRKHLFSGYSLFFNNSYQYGASEKLNLLADHVEISLDPLSAIDGTIAQGETVTVTARTLTYSNEVRKDTEEGIFYQIRRSTTDTTADETWFRAHNRGTVLPTGAHTSFPCTTFPLTLTTDDIGPSTAVFTISSMRYISGYEQSDGIYTVQSQFFLRNIGTYEITDNLDDPFISLNERKDITFRVINARNGDVTDQMTAWRITRNSGIGHEASDAVWNNSPKARAFNSTLGTLADGKQISLEWSPDAINSDIPSSGSDTFVFTIEAMYGATLMATTQLAFN